MLLPPAWQAAVSSTPKPKQASVHSLSPLVSDADLGQPRPCTARTVSESWHHMEREEWLASYYLPPFAINYHHHHCIAVALLHARCDACCVLLNPLSSLPRRVPLSPTVQVSEHR
jgi:hypothetical protein